MIAFTLLLAIGCDPMPTSGDPFGQVKTIPSDKSETNATAEEESVANETKPEGPMSFDEWAGEENSETAKAQPVTEQKDSQSTIGPKPVTTIATIANQPTATAPKTPSSVPTSYAGTAPRKTLLEAGWPLVVVKTLSDLNPPRAILGLPSGEELVVKPGQVLQEHKLVVMSIGQHRVDIVRISEQGDRAALTAQSLPVQN